MKRSTFWKVVLFLGVSVLTSGFVGLAIHASGRRPQPPPLVVTHTVSSPEFGVQVTLPSTWSFEPGHPGTDFVVAHSDTGAILVGAVTPSDPATRPLDATIDRIVEEQRARSGTVENVSRGAMPVGLVDARWMELSFPSKGNTARMKAVAFQRGPNTLTLMCTGEGPAQRTCEAAIHSVTMAH
jgi:hypothetical protein